MGLVKKDYDEAAEKDDNHNEITVKEIPDAVIEVKAEEEKVDKGKGKEVEVDHKPTPPAAPLVVNPKPTSKEKIRHEWYQSTTGITIDLLASGVDKTKVEVTFEERSVSSFSVTSKHDTNTSD